MDCILTKRCKELRRELSRLNSERTDLVTARQEREADEEYTPPPAEELTPAQEV